MENDEVRNREIQKLFPVGTVVDSKQGENLFGATLEWGGRRDGLGEKGKGVQVTFIDSEKAYDEVRRAVEGTTWVWSSRILGLGREETI